MSPVVQKLENVAITDPSYQQGQTRSSRTDTGVSFAGPPMSALPNNQESTNFNPPAFESTPLPTHEPVPEPETFAPLAYNPAAPAAPETIRHREKTPPPEDGALNPLMTAAASDHGQTYGIPIQQPGGLSGPSSQPQSQQSYFPGPPGPPAPPTVSPPAQSPYSQHFQNSFAGPPSAPLNMPGPPAYKAQPSPHIPVTQFAKYPTSPGLSSGLTTPGIYSPSFASPQPTQTTNYHPNAASANVGGHNPGPPPGGFAQYNYAQNSTAHESTTKLSNTQPLSTDYAVHQQVYRPTETEASVKHNEKPLKAPTGKFEARAGQLERGMTGLFKKLEKKIG